VEGVGKFCPQCGTPLEAGAAVKKRGSSPWPKIAGIVGGVALIIAIVVLLIGVGERESPIEVAMAFYRAGNEGNYEKAFGYLTPEIRMAWKMGVPFIPRFDNAMDAATRGGTIARIEAEEAVEYAGAFATVWLTLVYEDGSQARDVLTLMKVDGEWRIYMSTLLLMPPPP
jgi:hypothetical protein